MRCRLFCSLIKKALRNLLDFGTRLWLVELQALSPAQSKDMLHSLSLPLPAKGAKPLASGRCHLFVQVPHY